MARWIYVYRLATASLLATATIHMLKIDVSAASIALVVVAAATIALVNRQRLYA